MQILLERKIPVGREMYRKLIRDHGAECEFQHLFLPNIAEGLLMMIAKNFVFTTNNYHELKECIGILPPPVQCVVRQRIDRKIFNWHVNQSQKLFQQESISIEDYQRLPTVELWHMFTPAIENDEPLKIYIITNCKRDDLFLLRDEIAKESNLINEIAEFRLSLKE